MLPKWHILFGAIFVLMLFYFFNVNLFSCLLIFFTSVLIDIDHYLWFANRKKDWNLKNAYSWHKNLPKNHKPVLQIFHTVEFLIFLILLIPLFNFLLFLLIGLLFHSVFDVAELIYKNKPCCREYFLVRYIISDKSKYL